MFSLISGFFDWYFRKTEVNVLILGLDNAGKTTLLEQSKGIFAPKQKRIPPSKIPPTVGLNIGKYELDGVRVLAWDLGGQVSLRSIWKHYYADAHALVYLVDSSDQGRLQDVKSALEGAMEHPDLGKIPLLVACNKQDLTGNVLSPETISLALGLGTYSSDGRRKIKVMKLSALQNEGVEEALRWAVTSGLTIAEQRAMSSSSK